MTKSYSPPQAPCSDKPWHAVTSLGIWHSALSDKSRLRLGHTSSDKPRQ